MQQTENVLMMPHTKDGCPDKCPVCKVDTLLKSRLSSADYQRYIELVRTAAGLSAKTEQVELTEPISVLNLPARCVSSLTRNCHFDGSIPYVGDLVQRTEVDLLKRAYMGRVGVAAIKRELARFGLRLGTTLNDWPPPPEAFGH